MIAGYGCKPVFRYQFRPTGHDSRPQDGGFCVLLYENCILSFSVYNVDGSFLDEQCFSLPSNVLQCFYALLRNASSWLGSTPCDLRGQQVTPYASSFAFDGYDPIRVWGINALLCEPCGSPSGFFARHLYVLFEDIANLFNTSGITLSLDGFVWNPDRIHPFRKSQLNTSGMQRIVI